MRILEAELREIHLELRERFEISSGGWGRRRILLLRMVGEEGQAWSECVAAEHPNYSYETPDTAWHILTEYLLPSVLGRDFPNAREVLGPVAWLRGHPMAKATVEMGAWALEALSAGLSLSRHLGGEEEEVPVGVSVGLQENDDELLARVGERLAEGYRKIKVKIKPGRDVEMVRRVREAFPAVSLMVDANAAYTRADVDHLVELDAFGLMMIEQPLHYEDLFEHALLQARLVTPVCLDESIRSARDVELALHLGSCRVINVKPGRVGGLGPSLSIRDLCAERMFPVWCGGMLESGVGRAYNLALASVPGFSLPGDISESRRYWEEDIVEPEFVMKEGMIPVPRGSGLGVRVREERVEETTKRRWFKKG